MTEAAQNDGADAPPNGFVQRLVAFSKASMVTPTITAVALARLSIIVLAILMFTGIGK